MQIDASHDCWYSFEADIVESEKGIPHVKNKTLDNSLL